jgi:hypothetical protein
MPHSNQMEDAAHAVERRDQVFDAAVVITSAARDLAFCSQRQRRDPSLRS